MGDWILAAFSIIQLVQIVAFVIMLFEFRDLNARLRHPSGR